MRNCGFLLVSLLFVTVTLSARDTKKRSVYVMYTGGTIGMNKTDSGYAPVSGFLQYLMSLSPSFAPDNLPFTYTIHEFSPLLDSSNMEPRNWLQLVEDINANYEKYDGFVIIHGTDTLAYTASALSFLLENLNKTVVITGSQIPMIEPYSDANNNLLGALMIAGQYDIPEVTVFFADKLLRGNRVQKFSAWDWTAFDAGVYPLLATWGGDLRLQSEHMLSFAKAPFRGYTAVSEQVVLVYLFPGITGTYVREALAPPAKGAVLLAFGTGNGPDMNSDFLKALKEANDRGVVIVDASQCFRGNVDLTHYATASALKDAGLIGAFDMTPEAAFTKLTWLLAHPDYKSNAALVKERMMLNVRGEMSGPVYQPPVPPIAFPYLPVSLIGGTAAVAVSALILVSWCWGRRKGASRSSAAGYEPIAPTGSHKARMATLPLPLYSPGGDQLLCFPHPSYRFSCRSLWATVRVHRRSLAVGVLLVTVLLVIVATLPRILVARN
ncbi:L-asparaginase [Paratrimastix pyriformis]|uniref:asparaginase n=1 Tax=Paratrimastix pyriformis TaxID=342808 RepID=A0ABQ8UV37_9EUKA|nr:L-asparaginase [Paratrimastix pyriformis]